MYQRLGSLKKLGRKTLKGLAITANELLSALEDEMAMKTGDKRPIGFMQ
jgi:hypothetical protein